MTNEELTEEIYYEAYKEGFIDLLRRETDKIDSDLPHSERVQLAYYSLKNKGVIA